VVLRGFRAFTLIIADRGFLGCSSGLLPPTKGRTSKSSRPHGRRKTSHFKEAPDCDRTEGARCSPVPPAKRATVLPLRYFAPDSSYSVPAAVEARRRSAGVRDADVHGRPETDASWSARSSSLSRDTVHAGGVRRRWHAANSKSLRPVRRHDDRDGDVSAGRYLDLQPTATGTYTIDFNRGYNPYCAYNATYECPFPPLSNRLKLPIRAGEKAPGA
jgi:uncharacterized protein (DUF1684 family)